MSLFKGLLVLMFLMVLIYTGIAFTTEGANLVSPFVRDIAALGWPGQFNLDFATYLVLSAVWIAWRHRFSPTGIGLALVASVAGILFFSVYLLIVITKVNGDPAKLLLGEQSTAA